MLNCLPYSEQPDRNDRDKAPKRDRPEEGDHTGPPEPLPPNERLNGPINHGSELYIHIIYTYFIIIFFPFC